jgi:flavodoxin
MATILIIYPEESDATESIASMIAETLMNYNHTVLLQQAFTTTSIDIEEADCVIFGTGTLNNQPLPDMSDLLGALDQIDLSEKYGACFGVSSDDDVSVSSAVDVLQDFLHNHDAELIHASLKIDGNPFDNYSVVVSWAKEISQHVDRPLYDE